MIVVFLPCVPYHCRLGGLIDGAVPDSLDVNSNWVRVVFIDCVAIADSFFFACKPPIDTLKNVPFEIGPTESDDMRISFNPLN